MGIRFDPGSIPYNPSDRTGSMLQHVVLNRAGSPTFAAVNIDTQNPLLDHVSVINSAYTAISFSATATSMQLNFVSIINVAGHSVYFPCSASACTLDYCFVRDSYFENSGSIHLCLDGLSFNNSRVTFERTHFLNCKSDAIYVRRMSRFPLQIIDCSFINVQVSTTPLPQYIPQ